MRPRRIPGTLISAHAETDYTELIAESPAAGFLPKSELSAHRISQILGHTLTSKRATRAMTVDPARHRRFLEEDGEIWDSTGRLVGQSRQLALVPRD